MIVGYGQRSEHDGESTRMPTRIRVNETLPIKRAAVQYCALLTPGPVACVKCRKRLSEGSGVGTESACHLHACNIYPPTNYVCVQCN